MLRLTIFPHFNISEIGTCPIVAGILLPPRPHSSHRVVVIAVTSIELTYIGGAVHVHFTSI